MDWPAEVVGIRDEIGTGIMVLPVFAEAIGFAAFSTVAMPVGAVEAFQKRGVDGMADGRERQRGLQLLLATKTARQCTMGTVSGYIPPGLHSGGALK